MSLKAFIGDIARPFSIISTSAAASWATVVIAQKVTSFEGAALFIGAVFAGLGGLYWGKSWEIGTQAKQAAKVEVAKATTSPTVEPPPTSDGELTPDQRVKP